MEKNITIKHEKNEFCVSIYGNPFVYIDTVEEARKLKKDMLGFFERYKNELLNVK